MSCQYPVENKLARAATPKLCGSVDGPIAVSVPFYDRNGNLVPQLRQLCVRHTVDIAVWRMIKNMPITLLTPGEVEFLINNGFSMNELIAEGLVEVPEPEHEC